MKTKDAALRQTAWDLVNLTAFQTDGEVIYQEALLSAKSKDKNAPIAHFISWWDENHDKLGWDSKSYSFK